MENDAIEVWNADNLSLFAVEHIVKTVPDVVYEVVLCSTVRYNVLPTLRQFKPLL